MRHRCATSPALSPPLSPLRLAELPRVGGRAVAKPLLADGSEASHALALVYDEDGLQRLARGELPELAPPCVLQEFVDHGGSLFKARTLVSLIPLNARQEPARS